MRQGHIEFLKGTVNGAKTFSVAAAVYCKNALNTSKLNDYLDKNIDRAQEVGKYYSAGHFVGLTTPTLAIAAAATGIVNTYLT